ncbi:Dipeptide transport system permease protein DppC [Sinomonas atrocyanea]|uniref:Dipeptide transport system permease protein DppC n=1 Tax=Sinomonas atrocyanea TaxID=37927 RepID=A0A127A5P8_9MICC|nr:ABC transporter permease [Sinomonas atrocyanea]AMM34477.1 Dipeptide transport system permease protein DppC [Sinomonas atrocyanea]GEB65550.1 ABC transporter permease [Sinomonas atrocyanea]GGG71176.1 ABC transporter permease [Sinomonas atrocyanea]
MSVQGIPRTSPGLRVADWARRGRAEVLSRSHLAVTALAAAVVIGLPLLALVLPYPHSPLRPDPNAIAVAPNGTYWFGTDGNGMDVFSRTIEAAKLDLPIAVGATALALAVGVPLGLFATSGRVGDVLMRVVDAFAALPTIVIAVVGIQLMGGTVFDVVVAIAVVGAPRFVRLSRAAALSLRSARYVEAAVATGCSPLRIAFNHIFRNAYGVVLVQATLTAANALGTIAALNFLGVGAKPPQPSWGGMISDGFSMLIRGDWWASAFPTAAMVLAIGSLNILAGALENRIERVERAR